MPLLFSLITLLNQTNITPQITANEASFAVIWGVMFVWFSNVINENNKGMYSDQLNQSFVWGMAWFIFSEVMFFFAFFLALGYVRMFSVPWLGGEGEKAITNILWPQNIRYGFFSFPTEPWNRKHSDITES